jgi:type II secretory pathway pseudopilin PulG
VGLGSWAFRAEQGLSLVETTIVLVVLSVLTAVVAPAAGSYIEGARNTKAKKDAETIGAAMDQLLGNTGMLCLSLNGSSCANSTTGRVELLVSGAAVGLNEPTVVTTSFAAPASTASATSLNWAGGTGEVADARRDLMDRQFVTNAAGYTAVGFTGGGGPKAGIGWRGAYLNGPIDVDPWGYAYQANTVFLAVASDAADGTGAGQRRGGWTNNVMVISAGSNGVIQTAFGSTGASGAGDDIVYVVQGATR